MKDRRNPKIYFYPLIFFLMVLAVIFIWQERYLPLSFILLFLSMVPFYRRFERKKAKAEVVVVIAVLAAIAAVSRVPFMALPGIQPTSFVVITAALVFGPEVGFLVGSTSALASNLFLGQGPWTPWQMFSWGMMGLSAGYLYRFAWMQNRIGLGIFGFCWGFLFGLIMNLWIVVGFFETINWGTFAGVYAASFYFDLAHGLSNVFFIVLFSRQWKKMLERASRKFGILGHTEER